MGGWFSFLTEGLLVRRLHVFRVALIVFLDYKLVQKREKWTKLQDAVDEMWEQAHERNAGRVYRAIVKLEGLWVKAGQYLSTRADVIPEPYIRRLRLLQDSLPPRQLSEVYATIEKELGRPTSALFDFFDTQPLATASIAQVHRAVMKDKAEVVVKVQHVGIKKRILQDLHNLRTIVEWVAWSEPQYNFAPVVDEWANEVPRELNFNTEAENTREVAGNLGGGGKAHPMDAGAVVDVLLPHVVQSTEKVLILTYMEGWRLHEREAMAAVGVDMQAVVESITRSYAHQIYVDGFFNADPHPGNFLVSKQSPFKPVLLDFGLTKRLSEKMKFGLAKMLLAAAESDLAALLSSFAEMGLKLNMDMPEDAMAITNFFFRRAVPAKEALAESKQLFKEREERLKKLQDKMNSDEKSLRRNPVDAFPGEAVFFIRVLNLLRGLCTMLDTRVIYLQVMRPFAEATLFSGHGPLADMRLQTGAWVHPSPELSPLEGKVRKLLISLGSAGKVLGAQVCVYHRGAVIVDTAVGVLGKYDPRPVKPDSLFNCFSVTKGVTAALVHHLVDRAKISFETPVSAVWPEFEQNRKEKVTVADILRHTAGLQNALTMELLVAPDLMCNWDKMIEKIAAQRPVSPPGESQEYHFLTFGWLAGGLVEKVAGKAFKDVLRETLAVPLGVEDEFFVGIPAGVESRLATLAVGEEDVAAARQRAQTMAAAKAAAERMRSRSRSPQRLERAAEGSGPWIRQLPLNPVAAVVLATDTAQSSSSNSTTVGGTGTGDGGNLGAVALLYNALFVRRACIPSANGHFSARALARFYAALAAGGIIPPKPPNLNTEPEAADEVVPTSSPPSSARPLLGLGMKSRTRTGSSLSGLKPPTHSSKKSSSNHSVGSVALEVESEAASESHNQGGPLFRSPRVLDAFIAGGEYKYLCRPEWLFGLGYRRYATGAFGHGGMGGSLGFCDPAHDLSIALTVNKLSGTGEVTSAVVNLICSTLDIPVPPDYEASPDGSYASQAPDMTGGSALI